jgi:L,D-peptidoglycan transpeptidase YkuD (ErfK/YbiS/YcfS/YnhG family)
LTLPRQHACQTSQVRPEPRIARAFARSAWTWAILAMAIVCFSFRAAGARAESPPVSASRFAIPASSLQLLVVSSERRRSPGHLAALRSFQRTSAASPWRPVFGRWKAEIGSNGLKDIRREGDGSTPTGLFALGTTVYGNEPDPGGLHGLYHRLSCGDWWDEDPFSARYNRFVHVACGATPPFGGNSEALWTERTAYPYFAVIDYNEDPTISGALAPGSGIFLHAWVAGPTEGCVALPVGELLRVLRWLRPSRHPVIEIGTLAEVGRLPGP